MGTRKALRFKRKLARGFVELRFTSAKVKERLDWVIAEIRRALDVAKAERPRDPFPRYGR